MKFFVSKKIFIAYIFSLVFFAFHPALAGNTSSGGGDAVVCRDANRKIISATLFDFWEAEKFAMPKIELGPQSLDPVQKALFAARRLNRWDPVRAKLYQNQIQDFLSNTKMISNIILKPIDDIRNSFEPTPGCAIEQLAIQKDPETPAQKRFTVSKDLYDALESNDQRAGLILHEIIYWEARKLGQRDSVKSRYMNAVLSSKELESFSEEKYEELLSKINFPKKQDDANLKIHCVANDYYDDHGWWEVKIFNTDDSLSSEVWWASDNHNPKRVCVRDVKLTDACESNRTFEAKNDVIYVYIDKINGKKGSGKLWTYGCEGLPDLENIKMECKL